MKIAFIIFGLADTRSGGFLYDKYLINRLIKRGHTVQIFSQKEGGFLTQLMGNSRTLCTEILNYYPDLIIEDELNHTSLFLINKKIKSKLEVPLLSIVHHLQSEEKINKIFKYVVKKIEFSFLLNLDGYIFNSSNTLNTVNRLLKKTVESYEIIYPGKNNLPLLKRDPYKNGIVNLIFVGNIIPRKNIHLVLKVLNKFSEMSWQFNICGSDHYNPGYVRYLKTLAAGIEGDNQIIFNGRVPDELLSYMLSKADILIAPSEWEGFGISYIEAMRAGVIPIASNNGGAEEIIEDGIDGFLVSISSDKNLEDALLDLFSKPELVYKMAQEATLKAAEFPDWEETMDKAVEFLESLVS